MYYQFADDDRKFECADDILDYCVTSEYYAEDTECFDEWVDENEGPIEICGYEFSASEVLMGMNRDAYYQELEYWAENQADANKSDFKYELERMSPGENIYVCGYTIYACEDDEDDEGDTDGDEAMKTAFAVLEQRLAKQKEDENKILAEQEQIGNDFLTALGVQVI